MWPGVTKSDQMWPGGLRLSELCSRFADLAVSQTVIAIQDNTHLATLSLGTQYQLVHSVTWRTMSLGTQCHLAHIVTWHTVSIGAKRHLAHRVTWHTVSIGTQGYAHESRLSHRTHGNSWAPWSTPSCWWLIVFSSLAIDYQSLSIYPCGAQPNGHIDYMPYV